MHRAIDREERKEERKSEFKKSITSDSATSQRVEEHEKLRKNRRFEHLKRMRKGVEGEGRVFSAAEAREVITGLQTGSVASRSAALRSLVSLSGSDDPHLAVMHEMRAVAVLQKILTGSHPHDQYDALLVLTNLALADHSVTAMLYPALPYVVHLLAPENLQMAEQAAWCLGNVAGDCDECKARVMAVGAADPLIALLRVNNAPASLLVTLGFTITNLLRGRQFVPDFANRGLLALVVRLLTPNQSPEVVAEMMWVLAYLSGGGDEMKTAVVNIGAIELIVQLMERAENPVLLLPMLRVLGNVFAGPDQLVLRLAAKENNTLLLRLWRLLSFSDPHVLRELCWAISNLSGGPPQVAAVLVQRNFVPPLAALFNSAPTSVRKEIGFVFLNLVSALKNANGNFVELLHSTPGVTSGFVEFITMPDVDMIGMGIRWAALLLRLHPRGKEEFENNGGLTALEDLEYNVHKTDAQFSRANELLDKYFTDMNDANVEEEQTEYPPWRITAPNQQAFSPNKPFSF